MAVEIIMNMPLDVRVSVANLEQDEIHVLELTLGKYLNTDSINFLKQQGMKR